MALDIAKYTSGMDRRTKALMLRLDGWSYGQIAGHLGVTRQRIQQMLSPTPGIRQLVVSRSQGICARCGVVCSSSGHIHHKKVVGAQPDDYNDSANLVLLCSSCHRTAHARPRRQKGDRPAWEVELERGHKPNCQVCAIRA